MKQLNITFEDDEFKRIEKGKKNSGLNWRDYIIKLNELAEKIKKNIK